MNNKKGFTLVEIMIVVAIIGLLAAIAVPNFLRAKDREESITKYHLENGEEVICDYVEYFRGGINLTSCNDGNEYLSQQNVKASKIKKRKSNYE